MSGIYLDHNATTAPAPEVVDEMLDALQRAWANPSSTHEPGQTARRLLADARARVASFLGCQGAELVFTSGATEANHQAVLGALARLQAESGGTRVRLLVSAVEHPGLLALAERLAGEGVPVDRIAVDGQGRLDVADLTRLLAQGDVALVSVMGANNETGVCMPIAEVAAQAHAAGAWLHVDATQLAGKARLDFAASGIDLMSVSAHKLHGPKGVGALVVRKGRTLPPLLAGRQERHRRGGTENLPGIAGFAAACDRAARTLDDDLTRMTRLREALEDGLRSVLPPGLVVCGEQAERLPNTLCVRFGEIDSERVLGRLERAGVVASSGAACTASGTQPSHVLLAMGQTPVQARAGVRFSLGRDTTPAEIRAVIGIVARVVHPLMRDEDALTLPQAA
jgi:cysteine desulfurase